MTNKIKSSWQQLIQQQQQLDYYQTMQQKICDQRVAGEVVYPCEDDVFNAFSYVDIVDVRVVILGQDPYHGESKNGIAQAHGLAFSVPQGVKVPPSLQNMYKELTQDANDYTPPEHGNLVPWAEQGVLLLNTVLTVKKGQAHSHAKLGWETFTDVIIEAINEQNAGCVFMLWGSHAQKKGRAINQAKHLVLTAPHPSPLSAYRGFLGCRHFSKANTWLMAQGKFPVRW